jgi:hypothetical protein
MNRTQAFFDKYATEPLKEMLRNTGLGNHPEVVRFFARLGKEAASDNFEVSPVGNVPPKVTKGLAERLYGNTTPN